MMARSGEILAMVGRPLVSGWVMVDQDRINRFAEVTNDPQFIHVDPEAAKATPFGGTVAHGLLTLSLLPGLANEVVPVLEGAKMGANYGYNKIRFVAPVRAGKRIRAGFTITAFDEVKPGRWQMVTEVAVEIEGEEKPALTAEWVTQVLT
jgi:acyl dehydratase